MNDNFPPVTILDSELRFLKSRLLGKEYKIQVALPTGYAESKEARALNGSEAGMKGLGLKKLNSKG
jgi:hypothetical protein